MPVRTTYELVTAELGTGPFGLEVAHCRHAWRVSFVTTAVWPIGPLDHPGLGRSDVWLTAGPVPTELRRGLVPVRITDELIFGTNQ